ncbi:MAG: hypothetical protein OEY32_13875 [Candidatus Krumholzibacteria bacterium]|nr:hypothetical protein [Candidatus Krumholzibacteria bacterium]
MAIGAAGILTFGINAGLTPLLDSGAPFATTAASTLFLWRQSASALAALLLVVGSIGLFLRHADRVGGFGTMAFLSALVGSSLLLANEWCQVVFVRGLAIGAPETLEALDAAEGISPFDLGSLVAFAAFALGWIAFSVSMLRCGAHTRWGPALVIAGLFATPILSAAVGPALGAACGSALLGAGWFIEGRELLSGPQSVRG